jgi:hypothetical protein
LDASDVRGSKQHHSWDRSYVLAALSLETFSALEMYDGGVTSSGWRQSSWWDVGLALEMYDGGARVLLLAAREHLHYTSRVAGSPRWLLISGVVNLPKARRHTHQHCTMSPTNTGTVQCTMLVCTVASTPFVTPQLWSPRSPQQYTAKIELMNGANSGSTVLDTRLVKFGISRLDTVGYHWKLNGVWLYLHGYDALLP